MDLSAVKQASEPKQSLSFRCPENHLTEMTEVAQKEQIGISDLIRYFIGYGLTAYRNSNSDLPGLGGTQLTETNPAPNSQPS